MSTDIAITAIQPCRTSNKGQRHYRVSAKTSYVDETLFGPSSKLQNSLDAFDPPWVSQAGSQPALLWSPSPQTRLNGDLSQVSVPLKSGGTPIKKNKYRLKCCKPSYCDESLFGPRQDDAGLESPWTAEHDKMKMCPLLWIPSLHKISSNAFRSSSNQLMSAGQNPMKSLYPSTRESFNFITEYKGKTDYWKRPDSNNASPNDTPIRRRSQSLTRMHISIKEMVKGDSTQNDPRNITQLRGRPISATTGLSDSKNCYKPRSGSLSGSVTANRLKTRSSVKLNPPWKY
ncbi:RBPJ-interacting and tubulin-associated protein 1-like [Narcine bancroftii]|uniref:RBPJ-interacting and tubulin-associated protein 1-like n=1 Tax=Narcine bancroftii TaxID=1343680 RepID=UPI0038322AD4